MWKYDQSSGELTRDGKFVARGYSGHQLGKNNPGLEGKVAVGPIPRGMWKFGAPVNRPQTIGPFAMPLTPVGHNALGRSGFFCHGDSARAPGTASHGCLILARNVREAIWASGDRDLEVVE